jgi:hypothetical protein
VRGVAGCTDIIASVGIVADDDVVGVGGVPLITKEIVLSLTISMSSFFNVDCLAKLTLNETNGLDFLGSPTSFFVAMVPA